MNGQMMKKKFNEFQCDVCKEMLKSKTGLKQHRKKVHKANTENIQTDVRSKETKEVYKEQEFSKESINCSSQFSCGLCDIIFDSIEDINNHMDDRHQGRWKLGDEDFIMLGDDYASSDEYSKTDEEISFSEDSETQSGEE